MCEFTGRKVASLSESVRNKDNKRLSPITIKNPFGKPMIEPKKAMERDMSSGVPLYKTDLVRVICQRWGVPAVALSLFGIAGQVPNRTSYPGLG